MDGATYLATDDAYVRERIRQEWNVTNVTLRSNTLKSTASEPVFVAHASQRHRLNTEALVEMYNLTPLSLPGPWIFRHDGSGSVHSTEHDRHQSGSTQ
jgi:hypothetical protein